MARAFVDQTIRLKPAVILPYVLTSRHRQNHYDGDQSDFWLEGFHHRDEVESGEEDEVDIRKAVELFEQILGQEGEDRILGGPDPVVFVELQEFTQLLVLR